MVYQRRTSPKHLVLTICLLLTFAPIQASLVAPQCTLTDLHNLLAKWRSDNALILDKKAEFDKLLLNFEIIESRLADSCDGLKKHFTRTELFLNILEPAAQIPKLKVLIKPVQQVGERLNIVVLKKPKELVCDTVLKIRTKIDGIATKYKKIQDSKIVKLLDAFEEAHSTVDSILKEYEKVGGNPTNCVSLNQLCVIVREASELQQKLLEELKELVDQSAPLQRALDAVKDGIGKVIKFVDDIFGGAVGEVLNSISSLLNKRFSLPIPRGGKERGVGIIPHCCRSGYSLQAGLCYQNCRSGYAPVLFTCVERCRPGWTDIGVTCTRIVKKKVGFIKIPVPQFDAKDSYVRSGKIPAQFGNAACSCRRDKRYLEAGLCYNKCGKDHLRDYETPFLTQCLDLGSQSLTILDLAENLNIFEQAKKIPGLGAAIGFVERAIDEVFARLTGPIADALKVPTPPLNFPTDIPGLDVLEKLSELVDLDILGFVEQRALAILRDTSCRSA